MKYISILIGKVFLALLKLLKRGSTMPGKISKKIDKDILKHFEKPKLTIAVTGSSGKGSTSKIIAKVFESFNYKVAYNSKDSNEDVAIITTLLDNSTLTGKTKVDVAVFEIDERYIKYILPKFKIDHLIITNITKDQPPRQRDYDFIYEEIKKGLNKGIKLTLNSDDPYLDKFINKDYDITYYSILKNKYSYKTNKFHNLNMRCTICNSKLDYEYYHIENIGKYTCPRCKHKKNILNKITNVDYSKKIITIDNKYKISIENDMLYNFYNVLAAFTVCSYYLNDKDKIAKIINNINSKKLFGKTKFMNRDLYILNNKCENSHTYNQSILYVSRDKGVKTLILGWKEISRRYNTDDISWLYDINFELIKNIDKVICCGPQKYDIAFRMFLSGIDKKKIITSDTINIKNELKNTKGNIYAILNFDYVKPFKELIKEDL